jgi:Family of unknown function (DUF6527)
MKPERLQHRFVDAMPESLEQGVLYVSISYAVATHLCMCGCGHEVVTPLSPTDWALTYDGETVSLEPSIGNWSFPCQSHYFVDHDRVRWAAHWTPDQITAGRARDRIAKGTEQAPVAAPTPSGALAKRRQPWWRRLRSLLRR